MPGFRHILFPVYFSESSKAICPYVNSLADYFQAKVTLLHAVQVLPTVPGGIDLSYPVSLDYPAIEPQTRELLNGYFDAPEVERVVQLGDPAVDISHYARDHGVDLIMLPTHRYEKFRSLLLGSVTSKVLHDSDCAVWTAPHAEEPAMKQHWPCRNLLVAVDRGDPCFAEP